MVKVRPASTLKLPLFVAKLLMGVNTEPAPLRVTLPLLVVMVAAPGTLSVAPPSTFHEPPVSVLPENCGGVALIVRVPESTSAVPGLLKLMLWIVAPPLLVIVPSLVKVPQLSKPLIWLFPWKAKVCAGLVVQDRVDVVAALLAHKQTTTPRFVDRPLIHERTAAAVEGHVGVRQDDGHAPLLVRVLLPVLIVPPVHWNIAAGKSKVAPPPPMFIWPELRATVPPPEPV